MGTPIYMYDSVNDVPLWAQIIGAYTDGIYENYERLSAEHSHAFMVGITATGIHDSRTRVGDCEKGNLTPASIARWSYDEKTKYGHPGDEYFSLSLHDEVAAELAKLGLVLGTAPAYHTNNIINWWCADYVNKPYLAPGSVATQFEDAGPYDITDTNGVWPVQTTPIPGSTMLTNCVGIILDPLNRGYWEVQADGGVFAHSRPGQTLPFFNSLPGEKIVPNALIVGGAPTPSGSGYWLVGADGGVFTFGDAGFFGSTGGMKLNQPICGMEATPTGKGYYLVAKDGGVFQFGDAVFAGSGQ